MRARIDGQELMSRIAAAMVDAGFAAEAAPNGLKVDEVFVGYRTTLAGHVRFLDIKHTDYSIKKTVEKLRDELPKLKEKVAYHRRRLECDRLVASMRDLPENCPLKVMHDHELKPQLATVLCLSTDDPQLLREVIDAACGVLVSRGVLEAGVDWRPTETVPEDYYAM